MPLTRSAAEAMITAWIFMVVSFSSSPDLLRRNAQPTNIVPVHQVGKSNSLKNYRSMPAANAILSFGTNL
jgi:hypothetical protein